jgi:hypothetical protein
MNSVVELILGRGREELRKKQVYSLPLGIDEVLKGASKG